MKKTENMIINGYKHVLFEQEIYDEKEVLKRSTNFYHKMDKRRSVREFDERSVTKEVIDNLIMTASTAPSGAHKQPWTFCAVSNPELKSKIRFAAEKEEVKNYSGRMNKHWINDLKPLGTDMDKSFLEFAPWLIIVFKRIYESDDKGLKQNNYYVNESVGIACGMLITAIHNAGLVTLTHTPSPMNFLARILKRPKNERAFLLLPVGYPKQPVFVPDLERKKLQDVGVFYN